MEQHGKIILHCLHFIMLLFLQLESFGAKTYYVDWDDLDDFRCPSYVRTNFVTIHVHVS